MAIKHQENQLQGRVTLDNIRENIFELKREQNAIKAKLGNVEESLKTIMEIMVSRNTTVDRY